MKITFTKINLTILLGFCIVCNQNLKAQDLDFANILKAPQEDMELYLNNYISPGMLSFANGMAGGWYNTAKTHKTLGLDLTFSVNVANIPSSERLFNFDDAGFQILERTNTGVTDLPTLVGGGEGDSQYQGLLRIPLGASFTAPDGKEYTYDKELVFDSPIGYDVTDFPIAGVPAPTLQLGIGLFKNTDLKIRFARFSDDDIDFNLFGFGIMHDIKQWIPGIKQLPFDVSVFFGTTKLTSEFKINESDVDYTAVGTAEFEVRATTYQVLISKKISILTPYLGIGVNSVSSSFRILGDYTLNEVTDNNGNAYQFQDPVDLNVSGGGGLRTTLGLRLKLAVLTIHADYTLQEYNNFSAGIGLSIR